MFVLVSTFYILLSQFHIILIDIPDAFIHSRIRFRMSHSEDEDDFLSADEDGFDGQQSARESQAEFGGTTKKCSEKSEDGSDGNLRHNLKEEATRRGNTSSDSDDSEIRHYRNKSRAAKQRECNRAVEEELATNDQSDVGRSSKTPTNLKCDVEENDEEEALAERIRERNLKIARKFSAEIAKNIKASAPQAIPVKPSKGHNSENIGPQVPRGGECASIPEIDTSGIGSSTLSNSFLPPAPPPTPALSSSFNQLVDQPEPSSPSMISSSTQYGWRLPPSARQMSPSNSLPGTPGSEPATGSAASTAEAVPSRAKGEQARDALDRLADRLAQSNQGGSIFERVAADLKKVSIKAEEQQALDAGQASATAAAEAALSTIADLGTTLGGWGWSGATKLLSSATQLSTQVGSVLDSVVNAPPQQTNQLNDRKDE